MIANELFIRDQVVPVLGLLEATESHLGTWDVFLWILEVFELRRMLTATQFPFRSWNFVPECPLSTQLPCACSHPYTRNPQPDQSFAQTSREGWVRSCCPLLPSSCDIARSVSMHDQLLQRSGKRIVFMRL